MPTASPMLPVNSHAIITRSKAGVFKPKVYLSGVSHELTESPTDIHDAMHHACWETAVRDELQVLLRNKT